ncbi:MAG TPA: TetR/AcrR family transcriptional regulator [Zoogloea sp.]|uniref:TetR/AcrR family transcriptional regulator n=1 Tax=Zoogloea sp. TaxID=49181 RepID=UPI002C1F4992|nr:TetR/AcrR family transcriptional regulator [Zoogloea sp.]HMV18223.1 TetR/AcrR family transcriptional regulator [Rhodocyclaceae bacterium]HMY48943.1 TetR/AcrR family transcriptional regulator [Rhodocyclaceae bacterium]HNA67703.1 TetR/AcrR family transcriptional regulator [Rhodocyclaceae bacterium]HNB63938.1 TetR/AcrR family transcriptional regulator [Rhodocyclaceae bacterium]HNH18112.1 TetR/AcrR family transcriptional regulator [Zoogloea sp.]
MEKTTRPQLDRAAWIQAALEVLADEGVQGMRVEVLAKRLRVTKGSFYWHFKDRQDLLSGVLETWKAGRIQDIVKQTRLEPGRERAQIARLVDIYSTSRSRKGLLIELAVREWARRDAEAAAIVEEVDAWRLRCARELFLACGLPQHEASTRSMLLYAYVFGASIMIYDRFDADIPRLTEDIRALIVGPPAPTSA